MQGLGSVVRGGGEGCRGCRCGCRRCAPETEGKESGRARPKDQRRTGETSGSAKKVTTPATHGGCRARGRATATEEATPNSYAASHTSPVSPLRESFKWRRAADVTAVCGGDGGGGGERHLLGCRGIGAARAAAAEKGRPGNERTPPPPARGLGWRSGCGPGNRTSGPAVMGGAADRPCASSVPNNSVEQGPITPHAGNKPARGQQWPGPLWPGPWPPRLPGSRASPSAPVQGHSCPGGTATTGCPACPVLGRTQPTAGSWRALGRAPLGGAREENGGWAAGALARGWRPEPRGRGGGGW